MLNFDVILGAVIALVGGIVVHLLQTAERKKEVLRSKIESLVAECYEIDAWCNRLEEFALHGGKKPMEASPLTKIKTLARIYFPKVLSDATKLSIFANAYRMRLYKLGQLREDGMEMNEEILARKEGDAFLSTACLYDNLLREREDFIEKACRLLPK